jgi:hypothetical protein
MDETKLGPGFKALQLENWRQFGQLQMDFHPRLTVLTGANATGKSTILGLLARHFAWGRTYSPSPLRRRSKDGGWIAVSKRHADQLLQANDGWTQFGSLTYGDGSTTSIEAPDHIQNASQQYDVLLRNQRPVLGVNLTSHRLVSGAYSPVTQIPTVFATADQVLDQFVNELRTRYQGAWSQKTPQLVLKESLLAAATFGQPATETFEQNPVAFDIWQNFQAILSDVFPASLRYVRLRARTPDIIVETETGDFLLDEASGGLTALVELSWQIFLRSRSHQVFVVLLDEPENHLHPSLQREILPSLLRAFPTVQFVVATHSPFVVTATPDSAVYALDYGDDGKVFGRRLDYVNKAASAEETLTRVLGVESTLPRWAERNLESILARHLAQNLTAVGLAALRNELEASGLLNEYPLALAYLSKEQRSERDGS